MYFQAFILPAFFNFSVTFLKFSLVIVAYLSLIVIINCDNNCDNTNFTCYTFIWRFFTVQDCCVSLVLYKAVFCSPFSTSLYHQWKKNLCVTQLSGKIEFNIK